MKKIITCFALPLIVAATAYGHGDQVQITFNPATGKIETREIVHTASRPMSITDTKRVYVMPMLPLSGGAGDGWYIRPNDERSAFGVPLYPTGPGVAYQYDEAAQLPGSGWSYSGSATLPNLQGTHFGYLFTDGLKEWTGSGFADPGTEQMQIFRGDGTSAPTVMSNTEDDAPFGGMTLADITSKSSNAHTSVGYRLLGDGTNSGLSGAAEGDDGIYLLSLQLTSTASGVNPSDPFYYVTYKNRDVADALAAAESLGFDPSQIQVIPEPASLGMLGLSFGLFGLRRRVRR